jgi:hypothetical protein
MLRIAKRQLQDWLQASLRFMQLIHVTVSKVTVHDGESLHT